MVLNIIGASGTAGKPNAVALLFALPCTAALILVPFLTLRPNRILSGEPLYLWQLGQENLLPGPALLALALLPILVRSAGVRAAVSVAGVGIAFFLAGAEAQAQLREAGPLARVSLGSGFWMAVVFFGLGAADAVLRLALGPVARLSLAVAVIVALGAGLGSGWLDSLSLLQEYRANSDTFNRAFRDHLILVAGSLLPALAVGFPLGRLCFVSGRWRRGTMPVLNILQTTPSIAMFGLLMIPLAALVSALPDLRLLGIGGIGRTPAILALMLYSLLPIVTNTIAGFAGVPPQTREAGRAMGMSRRTLLMQVELPLAAPIILTGVRIVVVQNIGLATVAALIGGGGFGTLVFRGMGQTAMDLVLLGTLPIIAMAMVTSVVLDSVVEVLRRVRP